MKTQTFFILLVATLFGAGVANAQINVGCDQNVGIGVSSISTHKLNVSGKVKITPGSSNSIYFDNSGYSWGANIWGGTNVGTPSQMWYGMYAYNYYNNSDERLKENIKDITNGLEIILQLTGKKFDYKTSVMST